MSTSSSANCCGHGVAVNDDGLFVMRDRKRAMLSTDGKFLFIFGGLKKTMDLVNTGRCPSGQIVPILNYGIPTDIYCYNLMTGAWQRVELGGDLAGPDRISLRFANRVSACSTGHPLPSVFLFSSYAMRDISDPDTPNWHLYMITVKSNETPSDTTAQPEMLADIERIKLNDLDDSSARIDLLDGPHNRHLVPLSSTIERTAANTKSHPELTVKTTDLCLIVLAQSFYDLFRDEDDSEKWNDKEDRNLLFVFKMWKEERGEVAVAKAKDSSHIGLQNDETAPGQHANNNQEDRSSWNWKCITPMPFKFRQPQNVEKISPPTMITAGTNPTQQGGEKGMPMPRCVEDWMDIFNRLKIHSFVHGGRLCMLGKGHCLEWINNDDGESKETAIRLMNARDKMLICHLDSGEFELAPIGPDPVHGYPRYRPSCPSILVGDNFYLLPGWEMAWPPENEEEKELGGAFSRRVWQFNAVHRVWTRLAEMKLEEGIFGPKNEENSDYTAIAVDDGTSLLLFNEGKISKFRLDTGEINVVN